MKEKSKNEKYAEKWFSKNGFAYHLKKQYLSKTVYEIEKDCVQDVFELPFQVQDIHSYMNQYEKNFSMLKELFDLRNKVKA